MRVTSPFQQCGQKLKATRHDLAGQLENRRNFTPFTVVMVCRASVADSTQYSAEVCDLAEVLPLFDQHMSHDPGDRWRRIPAISMTRLRQVFFCKGVQNFQCPGPDGIEVFQDFVHRQYREFRHVFRAVP
jgi:hypothetical protein